MNDVDLVAPELAGVRPPWNAVNLDREVLGRLGPADAGPALDSLAACLEFMTGRTGEIEVAERNVPELVDTYWMAFRDDLIAAMPTMSEFTWSNFEAWAEGFNPAWLGRTWERPPAGFVHGAAWIWTSTVVEGTVRDIDGWLVERLDRGGPQVPRLVDLVAAHLPRVHKVGPHLVWAAAETGGMEAVRRLEALPGLSREAREAIERAPDYLRFPL